MIPKIYEFIKSHIQDIVWGLAIIAITTVSYNIGQISGIRSHKTPLIIEGPTLSNNTGEPDVLGAKSENPVMPTRPSSNKSNSDIQVVVSKKSTSKSFHYPWCSGASLIAETNKLYFKNSQEAISAGYHLAGNCKP